MNNLSEREKLIAERNEKLAEIKEKSRKGEMLGVALLDLQVGKLNQQIKKLDK